MSVVSAGQKKFVVSKFPLRLMPSVRKVAEVFSQREGVSLNQFINVAVAEKLAHLEHEQWAARRPKATSASIAKALEIVDRPTAHLGAEDRLPRGYVSIRGTYTARKMPTQSAPATNALDGGKRTPKQPRRVQG